MTAPVTDPSAPAAPPRRPLTAARIHTLRMLVWLWRRTIAVLAIGYFAAAVTVLVTQFVILPKVPDYRAEIEALVSKSIGEKVTIGAIETGWTGLHPTLSVRDLRVHDAAGNVALALPHVWGQVSWRSIVFFDLRFHSLVFVAPELNIRRAPDGKLYIAGLEMKESTGAETGLSDWVLRQSEIAIEGGYVRWQDDKRGAPPLALSKVALRLVNRWGSSHRLALRAEPPAELASPLDVRIEAVGRSLDDLASWSGRAYAYFDYIRLGVWRAWIDYPLEVRAGRGGLRLWADFDGPRVTHATADVALTDVSAVLGRDLPPLELAQVSGRVGVAEAFAGGGFLGLFGARTPGLQAYGRRLALTQRHGPAIEPFDFSVQWTAASERAAERGEARATRVDLAPLAAIGESLPLPRAVRELLDRAAPQGTLRDLVAQWSGEIDQPSTYSARARFDAVALKPVAKLPGFAGLAGTVELSEHGGTIQADGRNVVFEYPAIYPFEPRHTFDSLAGRFGWTVTGAGDARRVEVHIPSIAVANADMMAEASGRWHSVPGSPGFIDLDVRVPRAIGRTVYRYIPFLKREPHEWLKRAIVAGNAEAGRFVFRGDLKGFPFETPAAGTFDIYARFADGVLAFHEDWPRVESIAGEFFFRGVTIGVDAVRGRMAGVPVGPVSVRIPHFDNGDPVVEIAGNAEGPSPDFLRFLQTSPLRDDVGRATARIGAEGAGKLDLKLAIPLKRARESRVGGSYQFLDNNLTFGRGTPPFTHVGGRLDFTERGVSSNGLNGQLLGGATTAVVATRPDRAIVVSLAGTAAASAVAAIYDFPFAGSAVGSAAYRAVATALPRSFELAVESSLEGVAIDLPPPFGKAEADVLPLRVERALDEGATGRNSLVVSAGKLVNVTARFREEGERTVLEQLGVGLGNAEARLPERRAIQIAADLPRLDLDRIFKALPDSYTTARPGEASGVPSLAAVSAKADEMIVFGRLLSGASLRATPLGRNDWSIAVSANEAAGDVQWHGGDDNPRVAARLKKLALPPPAPRPPGAVADEPLQKLPALDVIAESFTIGEKDFGRLVLVAANEQSVWQIKDLTLTAPEGVIHAEGAWRGPAAPGGTRTAVDLTVEASDAGRYLGRLGQANAIGGGQGRVTGHLEWAGPPVAIDYPSLTGTLALAAQKGQFLKADPGVGRLLGVLSLQSLPRRINLDFRDVFSEGFAFDDIAATASVARGVLSTRDFRMSGPSAVVVLTGEVDLARETQNLHARVVPVIGDSLAAVAGLALLNPVLGLGTLIAQRLLKDPLGQILAYEYLITGDWKDPQVKRLRNVDKENGAPPVESSEAGR